MKAHEKKAVQKALDTVIDMAWQEYEYEIPKAVRRNLPHKAVKLAMLRAGRLYDYQTEADALEYAARLLRDPRMGPFL